jgi:hypothetical protein
MRSLQRSATVIGLLSAFLLVAATAGCDAEDRPRIASSGSGPPSASGPPAPSVLVDARTVADQKNKTCSAPTAETVTETLYSPVVTADGPLTILDARAVGDGVRLLDTEAAVVVGDPRGPGAGMSVTWPFEDGRGRLPIDHDTLAAFIGMVIDDGQTVLPLWRLAFSPDSHLRGMEIDYDDGTGKVETLFVEMDATYARQLQGC